VGEQRHRHKQQTQHDNTQEQREEGENGSTWKNKSFLTDFEHREKQKTRKKKVPALRWAAAGEQRRLSWSSATRMARRRKRAGLAK
jgi:hypothetical protein